MNTNNDTLKQRKSKSFQMKAEQIDLQWDQTGRGASYKKNLDYAKTIFKVDNNGALNTGLRFDARKITGGFDDLRSEYDKIKKSGISNIEDVMKIRSRSAAREQTFTQRWLGHGNKDFDILTSPKSGGGIANMYMMPSYEAFATSGVGTHLNRAAAFASGIGLKDDLMNSIGLATAHQKKIMASKSVRVLDKAFAGFAPLVGAVFAGSEALPYLTGDKESTLTDNAVTSVAGMALSLAAGTYGFRVGKELTHAATSLVPKFSKQGQTLGVLSKARGGLKIAVGTVGGLVGGLGATMAVDAAVDMFKTAASQDNSINRVKNALYRNDMTGDISVNTNQLLTSRQKAMAALSKSSLNDKAYIMGNEASILKGIY